MDQLDIREWNNNVYSKEEGAAIVKELDDRTKSAITDYNTIDDLAKNAKYPTPFGKLNRLKKEGNAVPNLMEAGDLLIDSIINGNKLVHFAVYVSGNEMLEASYDPNTLEIRNI